MLSLDCWFTVFNAARTRSNMTSSEIVLHICRIFLRIYISKPSLKDFHGLFFADHQVENIISFCFFLRIKILKLMTKSVKFDVPQKFPHIRVDQYINHNAILIDAQSSL